MDFRAKITITNLRTGMSFDLMHKIKDVFPDIVKIVGKKFPRTEGYEVSITVEEAEGQFFESPNSYLLYQQRLEARNRTGTE